MSENLIRRKSKVSLGRFVHQGLVGPKPRPKGVGDGYPVNIPEPSVNRYQLWRERNGTSKKSIGRLLRSKLVQLGKSGWAFLGLRFRMHASFYGKLKLTGRGNFRYSVRRKNFYVRFVGDRTANRHWCFGRIYQGVRVSPCQGIRQNISVTSGKGEPIARWVAEKWSYRLFNKNTGSC